MEKVTIKIINGRSGEPIKVRTRGQQDIENSSVVLHEGRMPANGELSLEVPVDYLVIEARGSKRPHNLRDDPMETTFDLAAPRQQT